MDVSPTEEQDLLFETARHAGASGDAGALGYDLLMLPESEGGAGGSVLDAAFVAMGLGAALSPIPFLGTCVLPVLVAGEEGIGLAVSVSADLAELGTPAVAFDCAGAGGALVLQGGWTTAPLAGEVHSEDPSREMRAVAAGSAGRQVRGRNPLDAVLAAGLALLSADATGAMQGALDLALGYVKERRQFGVPVGSFQAVAHMAADAHVRIEASRSVVLHAAWACGELDSAAALEAARMAKAWVSESARVVAQIVLQMHGGIAFTEEHVAHLHVRRLLMDRVVLGNEARQWATLAGAEGTT